MSRTEKRNLFDENLMEKARALHERLNVVDFHHDIDLDLLKRRERGEVDIFRRIWIPIFRSGGVKVQVLPVSMGTEGAHILPEMALRSVLVRMELYHQSIDENPDDLVLVRRYSDVEKALREKKIACILGIESGEAIGTSLEVLGILYRLGVRTLSLTWNRANLLADGTGEPRGGGLTRMGKRIVQEMNRLGMIVDAAHIHEKGFWDIIETSTKTVIVSHGNARALVDHPRNITDEQIRAVAQTGGVVGVTFVPRFVASQNPTVESVVDHIQHIANLVGTDHVGFASDLVTDLAKDFNECPSEERILAPGAVTGDVAGLEGIPNLSNLTASLLSRGFKEEEIGQIMGMNFIRVLKEIVV
jgi:membrane dipeptidase